MSKTKLICNCNKTMPLDAKALAAALKLESTPNIASELCRSHVSAFEAAVKNGGDLVVACTQEAPLFSELHEQLKGDGGLKFVNIRETAGWSGDAKAATPKIAALLALADVPEPEPVPVVSYKSEGRLLIIGPGGAALSDVLRQAARGERISGRIRSRMGASQPDRPRDLHPLQRLHTRLSRTGDRLLVSDRSHEVQGAPAVRQGVRGNPGDRFRSQGDAAQRRVRHGPRPVARTADQADATAARVFCAAQ